LAKHACTQPIDLAVRHFQLKQTAEKYEVTYLDSLSTLHMQYFCLDISVTI